MLAWVHASECRGSVVLGAAVHHSLSFAQDLAAETTKVFDLAEGEDDVFEYLCSKYCRATVVPAIRAPSLGPSQALAGATASVPLEPLQHGYHSIRLRPGGRSECTGERGSGDACGPLCRNDLELKIRVMRTSRVPQSAVPLLSWTAAGCNRREEEIICHVLAALFRDGHAVMLHHLAPGCTSTLRRWHRADGGAPPGEALHLPTSRRSTESPRAGGTTCK